MEDAVAVGLRPGARDVGRVALAAGAGVGQEHLAGGGFGAAPKFPPDGGIALLLREHQRGGDPAPLGRAERTLDGMALGGMYDQLGGGFCRYSVDEYWMIPHFEKMLYDNGPLVALYVQAWQLTGEEKRNACTAGYKAIWSKSEGFPGEDYRRWTEGLRYYYAAASTAAPAHHRRRFIGSSGSSGRR